MSTRWRRWRHWRSVIGVGCLVAVLAGAAIPAPSAARSPEASDLQGTPRLFPETGYAVEHNAFWDYFLRRGGLRTFGYPVSSAFPFLGCLSQFFQRVVVQQCGSDAGGAGGSTAPVVTLNLLDELLPYTRINGSTFPAPEADLLAQAPAVSDPSYGTLAIAFVRDHAAQEFGGHPVAFLTTFLSTVRYEDAFPDGEGDPGLVPLLNLELWGLPTSRPHPDPANPGFVYQRFQRGVMHYDAACRCTQGLLLADYLKSVITGEGLPADLEAQAQGSPLYRSEGRGAPSTDYTGAFRPAGERPPSAGSPPAMAQPTAVPQPPPPAVPAPTATPVPAPTASPTAAFAIRPPRAAGQFAYGVLVADLANARLAREAGFTHMSGYVAWKRVEPAKGQFLFNTKDQYGQTTANDLTNVLAAARDNGLKLILRIDEPPDWAGGAVHRISPADLESYLFEALRYARAFAPGTVEYVEVFNELNLPFEWGTSPVDPAAYARQLAGAYRGIKRADSSVRVVSAAMSQRTGGLFGTMEDVDWLDAFYRAGGKDHFDVLGVHGYLGNFPAETGPECLPMCFRVIELYRALMERHGDGGKRALVTEMGTLERAPHDQGPYEWMELPPDRRGEYLVNALRVGNGNYPWLLGVNVFNLDYATVPWNSQSGAPYWFSLLNPDRSPRPAYDRIRDARRNGTLP